ncbi:hypothetical protein [Methylobacterium sp. NEAU K]|uniref:hypothetical protein n=1 Tax=Methylobacterium sp. NEAU K TaxID=3064946 RepID=UPI0027338A4C|nr:hypothetical protein [Methylobacterium sp. NEAU K]MDP4006525.1 hypothetical protein [Methylobacterium sp. NEAU K]
MARGSRLQQRLLMRLIIGTTLALALGAGAEARRGGPSPMSGLQDNGDTIDVSDNHGGSVAQYDSMWSTLAENGKKVRVVGSCQSACTTLLGHVPRDRICVTPEAAFGFHRAHKQYGTEVMWDGYPADIKAWIKSQGGLTAEFKWMRAPDTYRFFKHC